MPALATAAVRAAVASWLLTMAFRTARALRLFLSQRIAALSQSIALRIGPFLRSYSTSSVIARLVRLHVRTGGDVDRASLGGRQGANGVHERLEDVGAQVNALGTVTHFFFPFFAAASAAATASSIVA